MMSADFESCLVLARMVGRLAVSMLFYVCNRQSIFLRSRLVRRFVMLMLFLLSAEIRAFCCVRLVFAFCCKANCGAEISFVCGKKRFIASLACFYRSQ